MLRAIENQIKTEIEQAIHEWIEKTEIDLPWVGDNITEIMASAAFLVLLGVADAQEYLVAEDMLTETGS